MTDTVWIRTEPTIDGTAYVVTLEASDDVATTLDQERALRYACGVLDAAHRAAYDAAVIRQLGNLTSQEAAVEVVQGIRADRPPLDTEATKPLSFEPGVAAADGSPFLVIMINGERVGQWSFDDARQHALAVLETVAVADLDGGYYRALISSVGIDEPRARNVVADLANHRLEEKP